MLSLPLLHGIGLDGGKVRSNDEGRERIDQFNCSCRIGASGGVLRLVVINIIFLKKKRKTILFYFHCKE